MFYYNILKTDMKSGIVAKIKRHIVLLRKLLRLVYFCEKLNLGSVIDIKIYLI